MKRIVGLCMGAAVLLSASALASDIKEPKTPTLDNLQAAFNGESNASAGYQAFAVKADSEGYGAVASLFRAAARAEEIHAGNHAAVIKKLGARPQAHVEIPEAKSTRENLEAAVKGETYERDKMYPEFIQQARIDQNAAAVQTFRYAMAAEAEHAKLYTEALNDLEGARGASKVYYVCPVCGFTTAKPDLGRCPTCATPEEKFERVS